jgi:N-acyl-D-amino-acid deacylase
LRHALEQNPLARQQKLQDKLWKSQRADGGWAQTAELASDAYATGQALTMLAEVSDVTKKPLHASDRYERGIKFLLDTQQSDGSWRVKTRSKPVQVFFDNGDPHGEHQFISMMATTDRDDTIPREKVSRQLNTSR